MARIRELQNHGAQTQDHGEIMGATEALANYAAGLKWDDLPSEVQEKVRFLVLDAVGCALSGSHTPHGQVALAYARERSSTSEATLIVGDQVAAPDAAFANTLCGRAQVFDDTHERGSIHTGVALTMTALALGERAGARGTELLAAVVAGGEIALRVAIAVSPAHYEQGFHSTGTCNVFGTAVVAGRLLGLDAAALRSALGLAGDQACGLRQYQVDGTVANSALHAACAATSGIVAALLAAKKFPAPRAILEGDFGFCSMFAHAHDTDVLTAGLGREYRILDVGIKPYPSCRYLHGAVGAMERLVDRYDLNPSNVEEITVNTFALASDMCRRPLPQTIRDAQLSIEYNLARMLCDRAVGLADFTPERIADPTVHAVQRQIRVKVDPELSALYPERWPHRVEILTTDGLRLGEGVDFPPGSPGNPLTTDQVRNKFRTLAAMVLSDPQVTKLEETILHLDRRSVADLVACLTP